MTLTLAFACVVSVVVGMVLGSVVAILVYDRGARLGRTGSSRPAVQLEPGNKVTAPSPEASANRRITENAVQHGAEQLMAAAKESGIPMDLRRAREQARELLQQADPLGGAR